MPQKQYKERPRNSNRKQKETGENMSRKNLQWDHTLDLSDLWKELDQNKSFVFEASAEICNRIRVHALAEEFENVADDFENLSESKDSMDVAEAVDEFDYILNNLYDIADVDKMCWVKTRL